MGTLDLYNKQQMNTPFIKSGPLLAVTNGVENSNAQGQQTERMYRKCANEGTLLKEKCHLTQM